MFTAVVVSDPQLAMLTPTMGVPVDPGIREKHEVSQTTCEVQRTISRLHWLVGAELSFPGKDPGVCLGEVPMLVSTPEANNSSQVSKKATSASNLMHDRNFSAPHDQEKCPLTLRKASAGL